VEPCQNSTLKTGRFRIFCVSKQLHKPPRDYARELMKPSVDATSLLNWLNII